MGGFQCFLVLMVLPVRLLMLLIVLLEVALGTLPGCSPSGVCLGFDASEVDA